ncbi:MAG: helix-turn-helix transcriptional regulator [Clostridia bacterium]|nr:helix-turn-helix transcriptional regulator [Clostridia bacterium]
MNEPKLNRKLVINEFADPQKNVSFVERRIGVGMGGAHVHEFYELEYILEGEGEQNLNGSMYKLRPGSFYLLTPIDFHSLSTDDYLLIANISFDMSALSPEWQMQFTGRRHNLFCNLEGQEKMHFEAVLSMFRKEFSETDTLAANMQKNLLEIIFAFVARNMKAEKAGAAEGLQKSLQYIFEHFREDIKLEQIATLGGYTPTYFSSLFHERTGKRFSDFVNDLRIHYAKVLLANTDLSITEVCEKSGFGSISNFLRLFKDSGQTPTQYRKSSKKEKE